MRTTEVLATIAVVGTVATFALFNLQTLPSHQTFLAEGPTEVEKSFMNYMAKYRKTYGTKEEHAFRLAVFEKNYHAIMDHNMNNPDDFTMGITQFADMT